METTKMMKNLPYLGKMRFRALIREQQYMKEFYNMIITLSKLTKECVMIISSDKVHYIINEESTSAAPLVWMEIDCATYFDTYDMLGLDSDNNYILLSLNPNNLARALSALRNPVEYVKLKLTNKQFSCITVEIEVPSGNTNQDRLIVHDVPVSAINQCQWSAYEVPKVPNSPIVLAMPNLRFIRNSIDKIKNISPSITIVTTNHGDLSVIAETESATIATYHRNLDVKRVEKAKNGKDPTGNIETGCLIDCKKLAMFLSALTASNMEFTCGVLHDRFVHLEVEFRKGMLMSCVIPAVCV